MFESRIATAPGPALDPLSAGISARPSHRPRPPFERIALALQGGGALGAYQAGVYQALAEADLHPDWVAGISIGAINAAIIAGNPPASRVDRLRAFWELVSAPRMPGLGQPVPTPDGSGARDDAPVAGPFGFPFAFPFLGGDLARSLFNQWSATSVACLGAAGFFTPRTLSPWLCPDGAMEATSYYDTRPLEQTLERLVDFDRINDGPMRLSVGTVNVRTGDFVYFDTTTHRIGPRHILASGALPPGFPAVEIDGQHYWDGGLVSNTPLGWMVDAGPPKDTLVFQVDLWRPADSSRATWRSVATRQKEIQYSSRTRAEFEPLQGTAALQEPGGRATGQAAARAGREPRGSAPAPPLRAQGRQHDPADLPLQGLRRRFEGLRVLAPQHRGALARRLPRHRAHAPPSRGAGAPRRPPTACSSSMSPSTAANSRRPCPETTIKERLS